MNGNNQKKGKFSIMDLRGINPNKLSQGLKALRSFFEFLNEQIDKRSVRIMTLRQHVTMESIF